MESLNDLIWGAENEVMSLVNREDLSNPMWSACMVGLSCEAMISHDCGDPHLPFFSGKDC